MLQWDLSCRVTSDARTANLNRAPYGVGGLFVIDGLEKVDTGKTKNHRDQITEGSRRFGGSQASLGVAGWR